MKIISGKIIRIIDRRTVIINLGKNDGIKEDSVFSIMGSPEQISDPDTSEILGEVTIVKSRVKAKEVAEKFTARVKEKEYSSLGIITELISIDSRILFDVPPESFDPPPKIMSSILFIKKDMDKVLDKDFNKFLKACFVQPRKKLSKNLTSVLSKEAISEIYKELNIDDNVRPHEVSSSLYSQMHTRVKDGRNK